MSPHEGLRTSLATFDPMAPGTEGRRGEEGTTSVYWFILVLGTGIMAPWNSWVLAYRYFDMVFNCRQNGAECEDGHYHLVPYHFTAAFYIPAALSVLLMLSRLGQRVSSRARIVFAFATNALVLAVVPAFVRAGTFSYVPRGGTPADPWVWTSMLFVIALSGLTTGVLYGSMFSFITVLPPRYTQACMSGLAFSGVLLSLAWMAVRAICSLFGTLVLKERQHAEVISFFCISSVLSLACLPTFIKLRRSPLLAFFKEQQDKVARTQPRLSQHIQGVVHPRRGVGLNRSDGDGQASTDRVIFGSIRPYAMAVMCNFVVTLAVFPGLVTAQFHYSSAKGLDESWYEVMIIVTFMVFDCGGRAQLSRTSAFQSAPSQGRSSSWKLIGAVALRSCFVPLYGVIANQKDTGSGEFNPSFAGGLLEFSVMAMFAFSNGYCSTLAMTLAPWALGGEHDRRRASVLMTACTLVGILLGALVAYMWPYVLQGDRGGAAADGSGIFL